MRLRNNKPMSANSDPSSSSLPDLEPGAELRAMASHKGSDSEADAPVGRHLLADLYGVSAELLRSEIRLMSGLVDALQANGFHILNQHAHTFPGAGGVTGLVLLSESHAAFHTYPEFHYVAVDVFSCGMADPHPVIAALEKAWRPDRVERCLNHRGNKPRNT